MSECKCKKLKIGSIFKLNGKYQGGKRGKLKLIKISNDVFINGYSTYLMESEDGERAYYGREWVDPIKNKDD